ncbi:MAG: type II toxin-antitoxin system RelE/ParE family toxin [Geminicoccaceae bacterium]|nr:MAG: type II toxin-antitoxin system RelE/ParE family toxin [Geminicoccaceae bacterium]
MPTWQIDVPARAERELRDLPAEIKAQFLRVAELIERNGPHEIDGKYVRPLRGKLWEIRLRGRDGIARAIYATVTERRVIILSFFEKKTQKKPLREIEKAEKRFEEWQREQDARRD